MQVIAGLAAVVIQSSFGERRMCLARREHTLASREYVGRQGQGGMGCVMIRGDREIFESRHQSPA